MEYSKYQVNVFDSVKTGANNLVISAVAGSGKTTTLVEVLKMIKFGKSILFLSFNKSIQEEIEKRVPSYVRVKTFHGLGLSYIKNTYPSMEFNKFKLSKYSEKFIEPYVKLNFPRKQVVSVLTEYSQLINVFRNNALEIPEVLDRKTIDKILEKVYNIQSTNFNFEYISSDDDHIRAIKTLGVMNEDKKIYDFNDMIYLPVIDQNIKNNIIPYDYVLVDECFPYDQYISTNSSKGKMKIGTIYTNFIQKKELPLVKSFNINKKQFEFKKIKNCWEREKRLLSEIVLGSKRKIRSTSNHLYLTNNGWVKLSDLKIGDALISSYSEQPYSQIFNEDKLSIIKGSILGDGNLQKYNKNIFRLRVVHGAKQKEYCEWKGNMLNCKKINFVNKNGYAKKPAYRFNTTSFYCDEKYLIKENIIKKLNLKSLAIMWMDDGHMSINEFSGSLYSTATNFELTKLLSEKLLNYYNIKNIVKIGKSSSSKKEYYYIKLNKDGIIRISELLCEFIHPDLNYKIHSIYRKKCGLYNWNMYNHDYGCMVITDLKHDITQEKVYDIEVEDNNNFIICSSSYSKNIKAKNEGFVVHNCQDLNFTQQLFMDNMLKEETGRFIAVGDPRQAIYAFAGADIHSFNNLINKPNTITLPLSYCYRCGKNMIKYAKAFVDQIEAVETKSDGIIRDGDENDIREGDIVLSRFNKNLITLFFKLLKNNKKSYIKGKDIGDNLINLITKSGAKNLSEFDKFTDAEIKKIKLKLEVKMGRIIDKEMFEDSHEYQIFYERIECIKFLHTHYVKQLKTFQDLKERISTIFLDEGDGIMLSTTHKAKGLENDRVVILDAYLFPAQYAKEEHEKIQEQNLYYVAITRAKNELIFINESFDRKMYRYLLFNEFENIKALAKNKGIDIENGIYFIDNIKDFKFDFTANYNKVFSYYKSNGFSTLKEIENKYKK